MVVAFEPNLFNIAQGLKERGYTVVELYNYSKPIDAVVYEGSQFDFSIITEENASPVMNTNSRSNYGVFLVCVTGKSLDEIDYMLKNRCYSSFI